MSLTATPPRLDLWPELPEPGRRLWWLPLGVICSLLLAALAGPRITAPSAQLPRLTPTLIAQVLDNPGDYRLSVKFHQGTTADYTFIQLNPALAGLAPRGMESVRLPDGSESSALTPDDQRQAEVLKRMLGLHPASLAPVSATPPRVRPGAAARLLLFTPQGDVVAAAEVTALARDPQSQAFLRWLRERRNLLVHRALAPSPVETMQAIATGQ